MKACLLSALFLTACLPEMAELPFGNFTDNPTEDMDLDGFTEVEGDCNVPAAALVQK